MQLNDRINKIKAYFKGFNIVQETTFVLVKFPETWKAFDETYINDKFKVYTGNKEEGMYFVTETVNGNECLFDAIDYVINVNRSIEEKQILLQKKAEELTNLFVNESLERLKTLEFVFKEDKQTTKRKATNIDKSKTEKKVKDVKPKKENIIKETPKTDIKVENVVVKKESKKNNNDTDTMSFMKELTGEK